MTMDPFTPPPPRDLPAARVADLRARVLAGIGPGTAYAGGHRRRTVLAAAAVLVLVAGGVAAVATTRSGDDVRALAFGSAELPPELSTAVDKCLHWNSPESKDPSSLTHDPQLPVTRDDVVVTLRNGGQYAVAFLTSEGYLTCHYREVGFLQEESGALAVDRWNGSRRDWLPGPAQPLLITHENLDSGDVSVIGRVATVVHRLVIDDGTGRVTEARFGGGMFAFLVDDVRITGDVALVAYDADGNELGREPLFQPTNRTTCYTDPAGTAVYGVAAADCRPAYRWR